MQLWYNDWFELLGTESQGEAEFLDCQQELPGNYSLKRNECKLDQKVVDFFAQNSQHCWYNWSRAAPDMAQNICLDVS